MAVLVSLAGTGWPAMRGGLEKSRIRDAGKQVRTELAKTRLRAIETGVAHTFRYQPDSGLFEVAPVSLTDDDQEKAEATELRDSDQGEKKLELVELELAEGVIFSEKAAADSDLADSLSTDTINSDEDSTELSTEGWSAPIVFHPNGRTSNARILLRNDSGHYIVITLRGLTGSAVVGHLKLDEVRE